MNIVLIVSLKFLLLSLKIPQDSSGFKKREKVLHSFVELVINLWRCIVLAFHTTAAGRPGTLPSLADQVIIPDDRIHLGHQPHIRHVVQPIPLTQARQLQACLAQARLQQVTAFRLHLEVALTRVQGKAWNFVRGKQKLIFFYAFADFGKTLTMNSTGLFWKMVSTSFLSGKIICSSFFSCVVFKHDHIHEHVMFMYVCLKHIMQIKDHWISEIWNTALFLRLIIPNDNTTPSRKRSFSKLRNFENAGFSFSCGQFENIDFRKRWHPDNHVISLTEFTSNTNPRWPVIIAFLNSPNEVWTEYILCAFSEWNRSPFSNYSSVMYTGPKCSNEQVLSVSQMSIPL